jgi:2-polyprenyl-3-methyl-5-hydroxy-6-metoxy-1,4-benzoquinol methylase
VSSTTITNERTSGFFDGYAGDFDAIYGTSNTLANRLVNKFLRRSMRLRFERTLAGCAPIQGRTAIDIGCGPGHYAVALARRGAARVHGLDFAESMIEIARRHAARAGVADRCDFDFGDFLSWKAPRRYDYAVVMGFMDYMADPRAVVAKTLSLTSGKAFFSFPIAGGFLAWQRQLRYRKRCDLYLYRRDQVQRIFDGLGAARVDIDRIARDFFVTATMAPS